MEDKTLINDEQVDIICKTMELNSEVEEKINNKIQELGYTNRTPDSGLELKGIIGENPEQFTFEQIKCVVAKKKRVIHQDQINSAI